MAVVAPREVVGRMNWSVVHEGKVYDVKVTRRGLRGVAIPERVTLERHGGKPIFLGFVMKSTSGLTDNWWTFGDRPDYPARARGFATRRYAIEHMLRKLGYWPDD